MPRSFIIPFLFYAGVAQLVERNLAKVEVESSRLFSRSTNSKGKLKPLPFFVNETRLCRITAKPEQSMGFTGTIRLPRRGSKVVMQRPAKPSTPVRSRPPPPIHSSKKPTHAGGLFAFWRKAFSLKRELLKISFLINKLAIPRILFSFDMCGEVGHEHDNRFK
jgi:hypothetical protein